MKYFTRYIYRSAAGNRAEKEADQWLRTLDGWLLADGKAKGGFVEEIKTRIDRLNTEHPRCRDIAVKTYDDAWAREREEDAIAYVSVGDLCVLDIYPVKKETP